MANHRVRLDPSRVYGVAPLAKLGISTVLMVRIRGIVELVRILERIVFCVLWWSFRALYLTSLTRVLYKARVTMTLRITT